MQYQPVTPVVQSAIRTGHISALKFKERVPTNERTDEQRVFGVR